MRDADEDKIQETEDREIEAEDEDEDESSDEEDISLQSRLSQMGIEKVAGDLQKEQQEKSGDEGYSAVKFQSNVITSTDHTGTVIVSSSNTTKDCESCVQERKNESGNIQTNTKTLTEREASLLTGINSTCSEQCLEEHSTADVLSKDLLTPALGDNEYSERLLTRHELLALFKMLHIKNGPNTEANSQTSLTTVGLVSTVLIFECIHG